MFGHNNITGFNFGLFHTIIQRWKLSFNNPRSLSIRLLTGYLFGTVILYLFLIYGYGKDISLAARYHFVYFPVIILVLSAILAKLWHTPTEKEEVSDQQWFYSKGKTSSSSCLIDEFVRLFDRN